MVRAIFPNLVATDLVSVQPMTGPSSLIFYLQFVYGSSKGATTAGTTMFDNPSKNYAGELIEGEVCGTGDNPADGVPEVLKTYTLDYRPVKPGSVKISHTGSTTDWLVDDGNGNLLQSDGTTASGTINYRTGALGGTPTFLGNVAATDTITVDYEFDSEGSETIPQVDLLLTSSPVIARSRKLRSRYSMEAAANLRLVHGIDAEMELSAVLAEELEIWAPSQETEMRTSCSNAGTSLRLAA